LAEPSPAAAPRLSPADATGAAAELYARIERERGFVPPHYEALGHDPEFLRRHYETYTKVMLEGKVERKWKEVIATVVATMTAQRDVWETHKQAATKLGVTDAEWLEIMAVVQFMAGTCYLRHGLGV